MFYNNAGQKFSRARCSFSPVFKRDVRNAYGVINSSHMRCATFDVVVLEYNMNCYIRANAFDDEPRTWGDEFSNVDHLQSFANDRLSQLVKIENAIKSTHKYFDEITNAITLEREYIAQYV